VDVSAGKDAFPASKSFCKLQIFILSLQSSPEDGGGLKTATNLWIILL
jgi:hypothetical protein